MGNGKSLLGNASGVTNQIFGWQVGGITSASSGNSFAVLDDNAVANSDSQQRPDLADNPNAIPCPVSGHFAWARLFSTAKLPLIPDLR
jgi:hypothetical protein